jgi:molybdopterin-containing oxidoreductase family iron-sulfur binding subunit
MENQPQTRLDMAEVRRKLAGKHGRAYWRSLEEIAETPEFEGWLGDEFPHRRTLLEIDRRTLLKFMGASLALAGLAGCRGMELGELKVVPYVKQPEELVLGKPLFYATAWSMAGLGLGLLVESHEGRPTKIEGNPDHPGSLGATNAQTQAAILGLYDPDRSALVLEDGETSTWDAFVDALADELADQKAKHGAGIRILTEVSVSPTFKGQMDAFAKIYPKARWHQFEPFAKDNAFDGARLAFGRPVETLYDLTQAKVIVSLDSDFLQEGLESVILARQFAEGRTKLTQQDMSRLYAFESQLSCTGATADHRWAVKPSSVHALATSLLRLVQGGNAGNVPTEISTDQLVEVARDLTAHHGQSVVLVGDHQPPEVHALGHALNAALGAVGRSVSYREPRAVQPVHCGRDLKALVDDMNAGNVDVLVIMGGNPAFDSPADYGFADALKQVKRLRIRYGLYEDETTDACGVAGVGHAWHLPATHFLEQWSDTRGYDGIATVAQPLTAPLYDSRSPHQLVATLAGDTAPGHDLMDDGYQIVVDYWRTSGDISGDFEKGLSEVLHAGIVPNTALKPVAVQLQNIGLSASTPASEGFEVVIKPDPNLHDGRFNNNGWLMELPRPMTQLVWGNAAIMSLKDAERLGVQRGDVVRVTLGARSLDVPAFPQPGHPEGAVLIHAGFGRTKTGGVGMPLEHQSLMGFDLYAKTVGVNPYALRTSAFGSIATGASLAKTGDHVDLISTQIHHTMEGRDIVRAGTLAEYQRVPSLNPDKLHNPPIVEQGKVDTGRPQETPEQPNINLYDEQVWTTNLPQWGMTIDLNLCTGCNACVAACQAENNIPVVGKTQVGKGREMQWLRIDRYYGGVDPDHPSEVLVQPVACVQCEKAPCEPVCPVGATVHSHEGLNQMVYNRCVGTRYCSNNCPYKVRRFNFLDFSNLQFQFTEQATLVNKVYKKDGVSLLKMLSNPDVTVRGRGVMEKCTYCVQRINDARIEAKKAGREIRDGEIITACQQVCPTKTIIFGNIADKTSDVYKSRSDERAYRLLEELNTRPRTSHLGKVRNVNPAIATEEVPA